MMKKLLTRAVTAGWIGAVTLTGGMAAAQDAPLLGEGMVIYMQMGGRAGDPTNVSRERGARDAAAALGVELIEQNGGWDPQIMLEQAKQALAAQPDGIVIIGNQGAEVFTSFLADAREAGITVVVQGGNLPGTGLSFYGGENYGTGYVLGSAMVEAGLKSGEKAAVLGDFANPAMQDIAQGTLDAFDAAGVTYDKLQWTREQVLDPTLTVPVIVAYLEQNPDVRAFAVPGHGGITAVLGKAMEDAGRAPGDVITGGYDISPAALESLQKGYLSVIIDQQFYMQGFMSVTQIVLERRFGIKGIVVNTATGVITPENYASVASLVEQGYR